MSKAAASLPPQSLLNARNPKPIPPNVQEIRSSLPPPSGRLAVEAAGLRTAEGRRLLRGIGFTLEPGECLAVVGPSGAGKSTLGRLLAGAATPDAGAVRLDRARLEHYPPAERGRAVGYLPQDAMLLAGTVAENIARMALAPDSAAVVEAAESWRVRM